MEAELRYFACFYYAPASQHLVLICFKRDHTTNPVGCRRHYVFNMSVHVCVRVYVHAHWRHYPTACRRLLVSVDFIGTSDSLLTRQSSLKSIRKFWVILLTSRQTNDRESRTPAIIVLSSEMFFWFCCFVLYVILTLLFVFVV